MDIFYLKGASVEVCTSVRIVVMCCLSVSAAIVWNHFDHIALSLIIILDTIISGS